MYPSVKKYSLRTDFNALILVYGRSIDFNDLNVLIFLYGWSNSDFGAQKVTIIKANRF